MIGLLAGILLAGCASEAGTLELESVLDLKQQKEREEAAQEAARERDKQNIGEILTASKLKTPEADLLIFPASFVRYDGEALEQKRARDPERVPPFTEVLWEDPHYRVRIMAGAAALDIGEIKTRTRAAFIEKMKEIEPVYDEYYQTEYEARANARIRETDAFLAVTVTSKYLKEDSWYTDQRRSYVYVPDYRLSIMVTGPDGSLEEIGPEINAALKDLERKLTLLYPEGASLPFASEDD